MHFTNILTSTLALLAASATAELRLNVTAITAENGKSTLECWALDPPFFMSDNPATEGARIAELGNVTSLAWSVAPGGTTVGAHNAPSKQWVVMLQGHGYVGIPSDSSQGLYMAAGREGIAFADDTPDISSDGHTSRYFGNTESIYLQIPTPDNSVPDHERLHRGPCTPEEIMH